MSINVYAEPQINRERTKKKVEHLLEKYRIYTLTLPEEQVPRITASYALVPASDTNLFYSSTEDSAVRNVDHLRERAVTIERVQKAVNRLSEMERAIMIKRYLDLEDVFDYEVYHQLGLSERKYYRLKAKAMMKLAMILNLEVYDA
jgi:ArpU family phage transcriptional regulator